MKKTNLLLTSILIAAAFPASAADAPTPNADQIMKDMGRTIGAAKQFSFNAARKADAGLFNDADPAETAHVSITVARPDKIAAVTRTRKGVQGIYADGRSFTLLNATQKLYSTVPMRGSLDKLVDLIDAKYGFTPPLAEFATSNPYEDIRRNAKSITYIGRATLASGFLGLNKAECHHIALQGKVADGEIWIGVQDHLPKKLSATFKDRPGKPRLLINFSDWNLKATAPAKAFTYTPVKGAMQIPMVTTAEMDAAMKKPRGAKR